MALAMTSFALKSLHKVPNPVPHTVFLENAIAHYNFNTLKWPESSDTQAESFADPLNLFEEKTYNNEESSNQGLERCCEVSDIELFT